MKLTFRDIEPFVQKPNPQARLILIYGPDNGLITERSKIICKSVIEDLNDPFNVAIFTPDKILDDPAAFYDEANAQSLMGGNRLILVKNGSDSISLILKEYLENPSLSTLVVIESDNLGTKSSLRALCEKSASAAALPCYIDDEKYITRIIREMTKQAGFTIDQDALKGWVANNKKDGASINELINDPDLIAVVQTAVDEANKAVSKAESIRKFTILPVDFTIAGGHLTAKLSVKRHVVAKEFAQEIDALFAK
jgi:hypothetical protein